MHFLIYNPAAGRGRASSALEQVRGFFTEQQISLEVLTSERPGHARELAGELPEDATVLVLGGDGTVNEVASACVGSPRTLGVLPAGSGDDLAFSLGLDRRQLPQALETVRQGFVRVIDSGTVNGRPFFNAVGVGFDAEVARLVHQAPPPFRELSAYLYALVSALRHFRVPAVEVTIDGETVFTGPSLLVSTHNGARTGGSFLFAPDASFDDGLFDVLVAGAFGRLGTLMILPRVMRGRHLDHPKVHSFRGKVVQLRWSEPRAAHVEGEVLEPAMDFDIRIVPRSLRVLAPAERGR